MSFKLPWLTMSTVVALVLVGCGGNKGVSKEASRAGASTTTRTAASSESTPTTPATSPGMTRLVSQAEAICAQLNVVLDRDHIRNNADIMRAIPRRVAAETAALDRLSKLTPPSQVADDYREMLTDRRTLIEQTRRIRREILKKNTAAVRSLYVTSVALTRQMAGTATRDGFHACAQLG